MKTKMKTNTKYTLATIFGSLIKNDCAIEAGKTLPLWAALIVLILSVFIPIIPTMVNIGNSNGSAYISSTYNFSFDKDITGICIDLHNKGVTLSIDNDTKMLSYDGPSRSDNGIISSYINKAEDGKEYYEMRCYYYDGESIASFYNGIKLNSYISGTTTPKSDSDPEGTRYYIPSILIFGRNELLLNLMRANDTTAASSTPFTGDYKSFNNANPDDASIMADIVTYSLTVGNSVIPTNINDATSEYIKGVHSNWKVILDKSYLTIKNNSFLYTTLIYEGVYLGLILLLGLLVFLLTRGKKNINRYLKFLQCEKIVAWSSLSPAILGLILGFLLPNYSVMFFILFEGIRVMWISMKQLSPTYAQ